MLAFDLFGNGESSGHSNGLGDNAQPAVDAALDYVASRPDVDPERIAAFGSSLGGEVLLEAAARDPRIKAVVSGRRRAPGGPGRGQRQRRRSSAPWLGLIDHAPRVIAASRRRRR